MEGPVVSVTFVFYFQNMVAFMMFDFRGKG